jgi:plasmid stabilization system protein ParE
MRRPDLWAAWAVLALSSCRGCLDESGPDHPLDLPAAGAAAAFVVPEIGALLNAADAFATHATERAGSGLLASLGQSFASELGLDPFSAADLEVLGIDPDGGAILFTEGDAREPLLALAVRDRRAFDRKLREIIQKTDGASSFREAEQNGFPAVHAGRPFGDEVVPAFHWAHVGAFAVVARAAGVEPWRAALARLAQPAGGGETLRVDPTFRSLARRVPAGTVQAFARTAGVLVAEAATGSAAITSMSVSREGFSADSFVALDSAGLDAALSAPPARDLAAWLHGDAAVALLSRAARPEGLEALRSHPQLAQLADRGVAMLGAAIGLDPEREVLPLLAGPFAAGLYITNLADLPQRLRAQRSLQSLLDSFHLVMVAEVTNPDAFLALLQRSRAELEKRGMALRQRQRPAGDAEALIFEPARDAPRVGWGLVGRHYVYAAGRGRIDLAIDALLDTGPSLADRLVGTVAGELAAEEGTTVAVVRLGTVAEAASQISINQRGPAIGVTAMLATVLQLVRTLGDVAVAVDAEPEGLRLRVRERLR